MMPPKPGRGYLKADFKGRGPTNRPAPGGARPPKPPANRGGDGNDQGNDGPKAPRAARAQAPKPMPPVGVPPAGSPSARQARVPKPMPPGMANRPAGMPLPPGIQRTRGPAAAGGSLVIRTHPNAPPLTVTPPGTPAPVGQYNVSRGPRGLRTYPPGVPAPVREMQISSPLNPKVGPMPPTPTGPGGGAGVSEQGWGNQGDQGGGVPPYQPPQGGGRGRGGGD